MRRLHIPLAAVVAVTAPATACINDSELPTHEREFRSSYQNGRSPESSDSSGPRAYLPTVLYATGAVFALGAGVVTFRRLTPKG